LRNVTVADLEERAWRKDRDVERAAGHQLLVVHVARVPAGRIAADTPGRRLGRDPHTAEERLERNDQARPELRGHRLLVQLNDLDADRAIAILGQETTAAVVAVVDREIDREHLHLEGVAGLGAFNKDRTGENMTARPAPIAGDLRDDGLERGLDL